MLGDDGFPPPGRSRISEAELHRQFVAAFPRSQNRQALYDAWHAHREELRSILSVHSQWLGGSFISSTAEPGDVDVVTLFDGPAYDQLSLGRQSLADKLMAGEMTKRIYGIDSYAIAIYPDSHPAHNGYLKDRGYWDDWLSRVKEDETAERGYLEVTT